MSPAIKSLYHILYSSLESIYISTIDVQIQGFLIWFAKLLTIHFQQATPDVFIPIKGSIYFVELGTNIGTELNKKRPCVIYSDRGYTVGGNIVIIPIKGHYGSVNETFYFPIDPTIENGLEKKSLISITDIRSVSKKRVQGYIGHIDKTILSSIDAQIIQMLGLHKKTQDH